VHVADEDVALIVERPQERRIAAVEAIKAHPRKADPVLPGVGDHLQRQVVLPLKATPLGGYPRRLAALRVRRPPFRQK
jgi:hypothetical protein